MIDAEIKLQEQKEIARLSEKWLPIFEEFKQRYEQLIQQGVDDNYNDLHQLLADIRRVPRGRHDGFWGHSRYYMRSTIPPLTPENVCAGVCISAFVGPIWGGGALVVNMFLLLAVTIFTHLYSPYSPFSGNFLSDAAILAAAEAALFLLCWQSLKSRQARRNMPYADFPITALQAQHKAALARIQSTYAAAIGGLENAPQLTTIGNVIELLEQLLGALPAKAADLATELKDILERLQALLPNQAENGMIRKREYDEDQHAPWKQGQPRESVLEEKIQRFENRYQFWQRASVNEGSNDTVIDMASEESRVTEKTALLPA